MSVPGCEQTARVGVQGGAQGFSVDLVALCNLGDETPCAIEQCGEVGVLGGVKA